MFAGYLCDSIAFVICLLIIVHRLWDAFYVRNDYYVFTYNERIAHQWKWNDSYRLKQSIVLNEIRICLFMLWSCYVFVVSSLAFTYLILHAC